jgi:hypothetical protein
MMATILPLPDCLERAMVTVSRSEAFRITAAIVLAAFLPASLSAQTVIRCDSSGPRKVCPADTRGGVSLRYQYSQEGCWQGNTWGTTSDSIWVSGGCKADFTLGAVPPPQPEAKKDSSGDALAGLLIGALAGVAIGAAVSNNNNQPPPYPGYDNYSRQVRCNSGNMDYVRCNTGRIRSAELSRQYSGSPCIFGQTWGYRRDFIWVDRGCRADFWVR